MDQEKDQEQKKEFQAIIWPAEPVEPVVIETCQASSLDMALDYFWGNYLNETPGQGTPEQWGEWLVQDCPIRDTQTGAVICSIVENLGIPTGQLKFPGHERL